MKQKTELFYDEAGDLLELFVGGSRDAYYDEIENGLFIGRDRKTEEITGFKLFAFKKRLEKNRNVAYERTRDILEIVIGKSAESYEKELGDRIFMHIDKKTEKLKKFTIMAFKKRLIKLDFHDIPLEEPPLSL